MLKRLLFKIAKGAFMGKAVGAVFQYCSWAVPVKKVYNSREIIAFYHPQPSYKNHIILSPKRAVRNLQQMASESLSKYFMKLWEAARDICAMRPEYHESFAIAANGGRRQEVQQVHFHMFTNHEIVNEYLVQKQAESVFYSDNYIFILKHPEPDWEIHFLIQPVPLFCMEGDKKINYFRSILNSIDLLDTEYNIVQKGYSLVYQYNKQKSNEECPVFHIISGKKLKLSC